MDSPFSVNSYLELDGEKYRVINYEKPYEHFAGHYVIQSLLSGKILKKFRHELCGYNEVDLEFLQQSQSDEELGTMDLPTPDQEPEKKRFKMVSDEQLDKIAQARTEKTTNKQTQWGVKLLKEWLKENNVDVNFEYMDPKCLNEKLRIFYGSLKTKKGHEYSKTALTGIRAAINHHITSPPYNRQICIMRDREFMTSNHVLMGLIKILKKDGKDVTQHKKPISEGDIEKLYDSGVFDMDKPETLQNKVFWDIMTNFGRRGQEGLHDLKATSYIKLNDDKGKSYYKMAYNESDKTHHGINSKETTHECRMYENDSNNCPVKSLDLCLSKLNPKCLSLFQQPLQFPKQTCWYAAQPLGKNKLSNWMSRLSKSANLSKVYTNHCVRATVATALKRQGVDLLDVMSITGHRNIQSLDSYINESTDSERRNLSKVLQCATTVLSPNPHAQCESTTNLELTCSQSTKSSNLQVIQDKKTASSYNIFANSTITGGSFTININVKNRELP